MMRHATTAIAALLLVAAHAAVQVVVETKTFHAQGRGPRVEVNMAIIAGSAIALPNSAGFMQARVEALTLLEQNGAIKAFAKTEVLGPERLDSVQVDLLHQEFFDVAPGSYELTIELRDLNGDTTRTFYQAPLAVGALPEGLSISELLFAERIIPAEEGRPGKFGYQVVPLLSDYFPSSIGVLEFYAEVYGGDRHFGTDSLYLLTTQIESAEKAGVFSSYKRIQRMKARPAEPVMAHFDIAQLPSGNYLAVVEVRNKRGELVSRREQFFQRNNRVAYNYDLQAMSGIELTNTFAGAFTDADSLAEHINSLRPIADPLERKIIDDRWKDRDMEMMRRFFYSFWANRNPDPEAAWAAYRHEVIKVNKLFGCRVQKGYETDRGYVYLKYGPPNTMMDRFNEMDSYPYTIWHYYRAGKYTNRRFVFYQPDLVSSCLQMLHSEVPGEIQNPRWNQILHSRNTPMPNVDPTQVGTSSGERANEFFNDPR
ncbi:MAG: GWxTD domain-containing protein [Flavobacteriales bacterium]|nr:GWxTD domain-containing protein [Flavobacteriales bacterium]